MKCFYKIPWSSKCDFHYAQEISLITQRAFGKRLYERYSASFNQIGAFNCAWKKHCESFSVQRAINWISNEQFIFALVCRRSKLIDTDVEASLLFMFNGITMTLASAFHSGTKMAELTRKHRALTFQAWICCILFHFLIAQCIE